MELVLLILLGLFLLNIILIAFIPQINNSTGFIMLLIIILTTLSIGITGNLIVNSPTAIDVYRGITTLEITYKDSIAVDSVVVFK